MIYSKKLIQQTVKAETPDEFDFSMNAIFAKASKTGKEPEVHFIDSLGLCAVVRYWVYQEIPETISDKYESIGKGCVCSECSKFVLPFDKRIKKVRCETSGRLVSADSACCDSFYLEKEREAQNEAL